MEEIILQGNKKELIEILESHIAYLQASGYDSSSNPYYGHPELNICYNFLQQLDEFNRFLPKVENQDSSIYY
jgi:hypothetical protein